MQTRRITRLSDSYKITHWRQYPPGTSNIYSYFESRGGQFPTTTFFGLQYYLKEFLVGDKVDYRLLAHDEAYFAAHFGNASLFNRAGWEYIASHHSGRLPLSIRAVLEGTTIPTLNALITVEATDPNCYWLPNFIETLLVEVWYGTTVCTLSRACKQIIARYLELTGDPALIPFKLHDFGFRGVSSVESAGVGGAGHLVNFLGTDTLAACDLVLDYYTPDRLEIFAKPEEVQAFYKKYMPGFSIPASEHSTMTSWGKDAEKDACRNMLTQYPNGLVACVIDSFDPFNCCENIFGGELRDLVLSRKGGFLVVRPDSGNPPEIVCKCLEILGRKLGATKNAKGFKVLAPQIRMIQGDGIDIGMIDTILAAMKDEGWSADNIAFGSGGALLQKLNRDTQKFAFKCSNATVNGQQRDVYKDPVTDPGKKSKRGRLALVNGPNGWQTVPEQSAAPGENQLVEVFRDGKLLVDQSFADIRARAAL